MTEANHVNQRVTNAMLGLKLDAVIRKLDELAGWQRDDHDWVTRHDERITTLFNQDAQLHSQDAQLRSEIAEVDRTRKIEGRLIGALDGIAAIAAFFAGRIQI